MAVLLYIITKVQISDAFNFHGFASSAKIAKINRWRNFLVLQYVDKFQVCVNKYKERTEGEDAKKKANPVDGIVSCFLVAWFICGM